MGGFLGGRLVGYSLRSLGYLVLLDIDIASLLLLLD